MCSMGETKGTGLWGSLSSTGGTGVEAVKLKSSLIISSPLLNKNSLPLKNLEKHWILTWLCKVRSSCSLSGRELDEKIDTTLMSA